MNIMYQNLPPVIRMIGGVASSVCALMCEKPFLAVSLSVLTAVFLLPKGRGDDAPIEVPGETMPAFADRLMEHLLSCGLRVSPKTVRDSSRAKSLESSLNSLRPTANSSWL